jgi:5-methyltetrahydrofolate--homocysteine methyltransferase
MLEGAGFTVIDLGVNVAAGEVRRADRRALARHRRLLGVPHTTMPMFKANINALEKAGIRDDVIVMVGGAPVTQEYADAVGADGYSADASSAVKKAKALIEERPRARGGMSLLETVEHAVKGPIWDCRMCGSASCTTPA